MQCHKVFARVLWFFLFSLYFLPNTTIAQQECATDFYSQGTCKSFDNKQVVKEHNLWPTIVRFSSGQIWHRAAPDDAWISLWRHQGVSKNRAIHRLRCITDLFGVTVCDETNPATNELKSGALD